jgi:hypothetical protein
MNRKHIEPVKQVFPKCLFFNKRAQIPIGRCDNPDVNPNFTVVADTEVAL